MCKSRKFELILLRFVSTILNYSTNSTVRELTIVIPAYNEAESLETYLPEVITFCQQNDYEVIIVNDGSKDRTLQILEQHKGKDCFNYYSHKLNRGYGGAIKTGVLNAQTEYVITIDADGQHLLEDVTNLYHYIKEQNADMVVGSRKGNKEASLYRGMGKKLIRTFAKILMPIHIYDINSGMKIYSTELGKKYLHLCPNHMAYSDIIALVFINQRHLVMEKNIKINPRISGVSTINTMTALETVREILNIVMLFNPIRVFLPIAFFLIVFGAVWEFPFLIKGMGMSVGATLLIVSGLIFFFLGLLAEQLSQMRKSSIK